MKITKEKLVEIIKEEIQNLEEFRLSKIFKPPPSSERPERREKGRASNDASYSGTDAIKDYEKDMAEREIDSLGRFAPGHKVARVAIDRAAKMDAEASKKDFTRVMKWANDNKIATERDIAKSILKAIETMDSGMIAKIQEPLLSDDDFIEELIDKINQFKHKSGE